MSYDGNKIIGVIPMRKGSKRLPNKNIKMLDGMPMFMYSVKQGLKSEFIDTVLLCTNYDLDVSDDLVYVKLPDHLCSDQSSSEVAVKYALEKEGKDFDAVVLLQVTSPLRSVDDIDRSIELFYACEKGVISSDASDKSGKPNGAVYVRHVKHILNGGGFNDKPLIRYWMSSDRSIDVDTIDDFNKVLNYLGDKHEF